jgi:hypothetical protein
VAKIDFMLEQIVDANPSHFRNVAGQETVPLDSYSSSLHPITYRRGLRELLEKEFLFRSPNPGLFFVNIRFMFNGDRLAFVNGYKLKKDHPTLPGLELEPSPALPAPQTAAHALMRIALQQPLRRQALGTSRIHNINIA